MARAFEREPRGHRVPPDPCVSHEFSGRASARAPVRCDDDDARGCNAVLTDAGLARLEQAWPSNLASVRRHFLDHLEGVDLARLAGVIQNVAGNA